MENMGTIIEQQLVKSFEWNGKYYNKYLIRFKEHQGFHLINRCLDYHQELIGSQIIFDYSSEQSRVTKYKIINSQ